LLSSIVRTAQLQSGESVQELNFTQRRARRLHPQTMKASSSRTGRSANRTAADPAVAAIASARAAGLRYVSDAMPGIRRIASGKQFRYVRPDGKALRDAETLARIRSLVVPPAWSDVWICPLENGHIQVTARDARGRKQYRYHSRWRAVRDETKYEKLAAFGRALPLIRRKVDADLGRAGLPREKVLAAVVRLLESTFMRVGNERYARDNGSFGLTTLRNQHVRVDGHHIKFHFRGKSGKQHAIGLDDKRLAVIIRRCRDLPGYELFQYLDDDGTAHTVDSGEVNDYLRSLTGEDYTAKDFRTWAGTVLAALALQEYEKFESAAQARKNVVRAIEAVAAQLGNTPSICRKCYIHPRIINMYLDGTMVRALKRRAEKTLREDVHALQPEEAAVVGLLQQRLEREAVTNRHAKRHRSNRSGTAAAKRFPARAGRAGVRA
jgi:DNA topoisomerase-1